LMLLPSTRRVRTLARSETLRLFILHIMLEHVDSVKRYL
jgi:hypothetical protein